MADDKEWISAYLEAFSAANPGSELPTILRLSPGWYEYSPGGKKCRKRDVLRWTENLRNRIARNGEPPKP